MKLLLYFYENLHASVGFLCGRWWCVKQAKTDKKQGTIYLSISKFIELTVNISSLCSLETENAGHVYLQQLQSRNFTKICHFLSKEEKRSLCFFLLKYAKEMKMLNKVW